MLNYIKEKITDNFLHKMWYYCRETIC